MSLGVTLPSTTPAVQRAASRLPNRRTSPRRPRRAVHESWRAPVETFGHHPMRGV